MLCGIGDVDLIRSNAEAPHYNEIFCFLKDPRRQLGLRANADYMHIPASISSRIREIRKAMCVTPPYLLNEFILWERRLQECYLVTLRFQSISTSQVDVFQ